MHMKPARAAIAAPKVSSQNTQGLHGVQGPRMAARPKNGRAVCAAALTPAVFGIEFVDQAEGRGDLRGLAP